MKQPRSKRLWCMMLGLALFLPTIPFAVFAQSGEKNADSEEIILTLDGTFCGSGIFAFEGQMVRYKHNKDSYPANVKIDGVPWEDLSEPFKLDFTPDFEKASIVDRSKQFGIVISSSLTTGRDSFELSINTLYGGGGSHYVVKIAAKNQKINTNPIAPDAIESTNGMDHQDVLVNTRYIAPPDYIHGDRVFLNGTVDQMTGFRIHGNQVYYLVCDAAPSGYSGGGGITFDGKFASDVTVNGKIWSNLAKPFELDFPVSLPSYRRMNLKAENCTISYSVNGDMIEIIIKNNSKTAAPFEVQLFFKDPNSKGH